MFLVQMFLGIFLADYIQYSGLRRFINGNIARGIRYLFRHNRERTPQNLEPLKLLPSAQQDTPTTASNQQTTKPQKETMPSQVEWDKYRHELIVEESQVKDWLNKNPDLKRANGG